MLKVKEGLYLNEDNGQTFSVEFYGFKNKFINIYYPDFLRDNEVFADEDKEYIDLLLKTGKITYIGKI